jgi:hypothetical protein
MEHKHTQFALELGIRLPLRIEIDCVSDGGNSKHADSGRRNNGRSLHWGDLKEGKERREEECEGSSPQRFFLLPEVNEPLILYT